MAIYKIGDVVWAANRRRVEKSMVCPDCLGKKFLTVILGDDSRVTIDCASCDEDLYSGPSGLIRYYQEEVQAEMITIEGLEEMAGKVEYKYKINGCCCYVIKEQDVFPTKEEAQMRALKLAQEYEQSERDRINYKLKPAKNWAWHIRYYRDNIKRAQKEIEYTTLQLEAAKKHTKEPEQ